MVFYRKYRPQTFSEMVGQETVKQALVSALAKGTLGQSLLFCGPRGCGKTSTARIVAKSLNCENIRRLSAAVGSKKLATNEWLPTADLSVVDPCNECASCRAITQGSHIDIIEIDAASNRGIDDIRGLQERIGLSPSIAKQKVYIIDEVHMLTTEAFNALLKTLEEPPAHTILILATTEAQKIPQTILSRCNRYNFTLASKKELIQALTRVAKEEKIKIDDDALALLADRAEGGFRDAVKLLDQVAGMGTAITYGTIEAYFHMPTQGMNLQFLQYLIAGQEHEALALLSSIALRGESLQSFTVQFLRLLRSLLLLQVNLTPTGNDGGLADKNLALQKFTQAVSKADIIVLLKLFTQAEREMKGMSLPQLPLELATIEFVDLAHHIATARPGQPTTNGRPPAKKEKEEAKEVVTQELLADPALPPEEIGAMIAESSDNIVSANVAEIEEKLASGQQKELTKRPAINDRPPTKKTHPNGSLEVIRTSWPAVIQAVKEQNHSVALLLRNAALKQYENDVLTVCVFYKFHKERLENEKVRKFIESVFADTFGKPIRLACTLGEKPQKVAEPQEIDEVLTEVFGIEVIEDV